MRLRPCVRPHLGVASITRTGSTSSEHADDSSERSSRCGTSKTAIQRRAESGGKATPAAPENAPDGIRPKICLPVRPMLPTLRTAVVQLKSMTVKNLPRTISERVAGQMSSVSIVPRSFSPATRSIAG